MNATIRIAPPQSVQSSKHAVAVIVTYLNTIKHGQETPPAEDDDRRWKILEKFRHEPDPEDDELDEEGDYDLDDRRRSSRTAGRSDTRSESLHTFPENKSQAELIELLQSSCWLARSCSKAVSITERRNNRETGCRA